MSANAAVGGSRLLAGVFAGVAATSAVMGSAAGPWLAGQASGSGQELQTLTSRLEALAKSVNDISKSRGGSTIVVNGGGQNSYKTTTLVAIALTASTYLFLRFRKWTLADCFGLVSKKALQEGLDIVGHTMENFGQSLKTLVAQVKRVKNKLSGQIDEVDKKLSSKIDRVDDRVKENLELTETVKTELDMIQATTEVIEVRLLDADSRVTYVQRGVQLLCSVVGETLSGGKNNALGNSLKDFAKREPPKVPSARKAMRKGEGGDIGDADGGAGDLSTDHHRLFDDDEFDEIDEGSEDRDSEGMRGVDTDDDDDIRFATGESSIVKNTASWT
ncbi:hypothetical protein TrRE_jg5055 [Triparma retinervis]|uniref:DUF1664 domain-containing protein n=1 Tax=Triparma retinervis TaxID=2557542 RepID=A0A9W7DPZ0_9STRA|nr:hypothetical protein TrRE_jg5055 [Triparma retinervis]